MLPNPVNILADLVDFCVAHQQIIVSILAGLIVFRLPLRL